MGELGDILVGGVDNPDSEIYPENDVAKFDSAEYEKSQTMDDEPVFTWKHDTNGNYCLCETSDYIIRPIWPEIYRVLWIHERKDFADLEEAKLWVETRVRAGL